MAKFRYRLDMVLEVRRRKEEREQEKYCELTRRVQAVDHQIHENEDRRRSVLADKAAALQVSPDLDIWKRCLSYAEYLTDMILALKLNREQVEKERLAQREQLLEAVKRRKMIESLKDKAWFEFNWEEGIKEQSELDEWASVHHQPAQVAVKK